MRKPVHIQLEDRRRFLGLSQQQLAYDAGLSRSRVCAALGGDNVTLETVKALCLALGLDIRLMEKGA